MEVRVSVPQHSIEGWFALRLASSVLSDTSQQFANGFEKEAQVQAGICSTTIIESQAQASLLRDRRQALSKRRMLAQARGTLGISPA